MKREGSTQHGTVRRLTHTHHHHHHFCSGGGESFSGSKTCRCQKFHPGGTKSRDKLKGKRKLRALDVATNHRLVSWRVVDGGEWAGGQYCGSSASGIVGYLSGKNQYYDPDEEYEEEEEEEVVGGGVLSDSSGVGLVEGGEGEEVEGSCAGGLDEDGGDGGAEEEEDDMDFCQVGFVWEYMDEEDWCVVGEMM